MRSLIIAAALAAAPLGGGWYVYDRAMDARYERRVQAWLAHGK